MRAYRFLVGISGVVPRVNPPERDRGGTKHGGLGVGWNLYPSGKILRGLPWVSRRGRPRRAGRQKAVREDTYTRVSTRRHLR